MLCSIRCEYNLQTQKWWSSWFWEFPVFIGIFKPRYFVFMSMQPYISATVCFAIHLDFDCGHYFNYMVLPEPRLYQTFHLITSLGIQSFLHKQKNSGQTVPFWIITTLHWFYWDPEYTCMISFYLYFWIVWCLVKSVYIVASYLLKQSSEFCFKIPDELPLVQYRPFCLVSNTGCHVW